MCSVAIALACGSALAAKVYKWVDEKGVVHYSDQPHANAEALDVKSAQTYQSTGVASTPSRSVSASAQTSGAYQLCAIARPENDEVFLNTDTVSTSMRLNPALRQGDRITFTLDGKGVQSGASTSATLKVDRGSHSLAVVVADSEGKAVCTTPSVTFHVRQPSRQAPNAANRPRF
jgi:hypothetical protein